MPKLNPEIISVGDRITPGIYRRHSVFRKAVNYFQNGALVVLAKPEIGRGPVNVVIRGELSRPPLQVEIFEDAVNLGGICLSFREDMVFDSSLPPRPLSVARIEDNLPRFETVILRHAPPLSLVALLGGGREMAFRTTFEKTYLEKAKNGARQVLDNLPDKAGEGDREAYVSGIGRLKGLGFGLTPGGDDFIAGLLYALNMAERIDGIDRAGIRAVTAARGRSKNPLTAAFLDLARDGFFFESLRDLAVALAGASPDPVERSALRLLERGQTSGADLAAGFFLTLTSALKELR